MLPPKYVSYSSTLGVAIEISSRFPSRRGFGRDRFNGARAKSEAGAGRRASRTRRGRAGERPACAHVVSRPGGLLRNAFSKGELDESRSSTHTGCSTPAGGFSPVSRAVGETHPEPSPLGFGGSSPRSSPH